MPTARRTSLGRTIALLAAAPLLMGDRCGIDDPIHSTAAAWLPDGRVVLLRDGGVASDMRPRAFVMNADGTGLTVVVDTLAGLSDVVPSPDGARLAVTQGTPEDGDPQLFVITLADRTVSDIGPGERPAWSSDGRRLAFVRHQEIAGELRTFVVVAALDDGAGTPVATVAEADVDGAPAWSPDGRSIAFAVRAAAGGMRAEVRLVDLSNGAMRVLFRHGSWWDTPTWSRDGVRIAVAGRGESSGAAYVVDVRRGDMLRIGGQADTMARPAWSPDGERIALRVSSGGAESLGLADARGRWWRPIARTCGAGSGARWSPDGRRLLYGGRCDGTDEVYVASAEGSDARRLTWGAWMDVEPAWSPDGRLLAFTRFADGHTPQVYVRQLDAGGDVRVAAGRDPVWSPDGRHLAVARSINGVWSITVVDADGARPHALITSAAWPAATSDAREPAWSPDGTRIAFSGNPPGTKPGIYVTPADGGEPARLTPDGVVAGSPAWSPDGSRIAYVALHAIEDGFMIGTLAVMDADGERAMEITAAGSAESEPAWSPDGRYIAFSRGSADGVDVYVVDANGGPARRLTSHPALDQSPAWSRDGGWIAFASDRGGNAAIWMMRPDGSSLRQLTMPPRQRTIGPVAIAPERTRGGR